MNKEIMKGSIDILILLLINQGDTYGYEIAKNIKEKSEGLYSIAEGTMYPALKRLEEKGYIESYWQDSDITGKRKYYRITQAGKDSLKIRINEWGSITKIIISLMEEQ